MAQPSRCIDAALLKDFHQLTYAQIETCLGFVGDDHRSHGHTVEGYVRAGRQLLHHEGVLPWARWDPDLRERELERWWLSDPFLDAVATWAADCHALEEERLRRGFLWAHDGRRDPQAQLQRERRLAAWRENQVCLTQEITDDDRLIAEDVEFFDALRQGATWRKHWSYDDLLAHAKYMAGTAAEVKWAGRAKRLRSSAKS